MPHRPYTTGPQRRHPRHSHELTTPVPHHQRFGCTHQTPCAAPGTPPWASDAPLRTPPVHPCDACGGRRGCSCLAHAWATWRCAAGCTHAVVEPPAALAVGNRRRAVPAVPAQHEHRAQRSAQCMAHAQPTHPQAWHARRLRCRARRWRRWRCAAKVGGTPARCARAPAASRAAAGWRGVPWGGMRGAAHTSTHAVSTRPPTRMPLRLKSLSRPPRLAQARNNLREPMLPQGGESPDANDGPRRSTVMADHRGPSTARPLGAAALASRDPGGGGNARAGKFGGRDALRLSGRTRAARGLSQEAAERERETAAERAHDSRGRHAEGQAGRRAVRRT